MTVQSIQAQDLKLAEVFQAFYSVPDYQREYVWHSEQVEQLLLDIRNEMHGADAGNWPEYFIGSVVVCPRTDGVLELIDGQQRLTTTFLILCAIRDRLKELGHKSPGALDQQIAAESIDEAGREQFRYRLDLQYEDSGDVLMRLAEGEKYNGASQTRSIANILNAYEVVRNFLVSEFQNDVSSVRGFHGYLINKVKLIRIQTEDIAKALKIFETINDRGVGLNSMDLLKNLLFMKASRKQFGELKDTWKDLQDIIFDMGEKPLRFLRYFIVSHYDVEILREDEIYSWFTKNENLCGYTSEPLRFAQKLRTAALAYRNFLRGLDQQGNKSRFLENMRLLGGSAARQHLILLLAGRHLERELFDALCREVENLFFVYVITREQTRDFERNFALWAVDLREVSTIGQLHEFIEKRFVLAKRELAIRFDDALSRLSADAVQGYRLRYILAKLTQKIDLEGFGETEGTRWLSRYASNGFEIEHIFPQNPSVAAAQEFGPFKDSAITQRLGNLVLAEKAINASLGNRPYSEKSPVYRQSQLLLTRALAEKPQVGSKTKIDLAVSQLIPFQKWDEAAVTERQRQLSSLARIVWDMPTTVFS